MLQPQDHKSSGNFFTFSENGRSYFLPDAANVAPKISGRLLRDAVVDDNPKLAFFALENSGAPQYIIDIILDMPAEKTMQTINAWMEHKVTPGDASLGESVRSSSSSMSTEQQPNTTGGHDLAVD